MSTITKEFTKEQLQQIIETDHVQCGEASALARIALASLEAEHAGWQVKNHGGNWVSIKKEDVDHYRFNEELQVREVYTAPPLPVSAPAAMEMDDDFDSAFEHGKAVGWNAYRAAMLQGAEKSMIDMLCKVLKNAPLSPSDSQGRKKADIENDNQQFESLSRGDK